MCHLENSVFDENPMSKLTIYCRYVADILVVTNNFDEIIKLKEIFEKNAL